MSKKALSLAFIGALLSSVSLVQAVDLIFRNETGRDIVVHPNYDIHACSTKPFMVPMHGSHTFDAGKYGCYVVLNSIDLTVPSDPYLMGTVHNLPSGISTGTYNITIKEENKELTAKVS